MGFQVYPAPAPAPAIFSEQFQYYMKMAQSSGNQIYTPTTATTYNIDIITIANNLTIGSYATLITPNFPEVSIVICDTLTLNGVLRAGNPGYGAASAGGVSGAGGKPAGTLIIVARQILGSGSILAIGQNGGNGNSSSYAYSGNNGTCNLQGDNYTGGGAGAAGGGAAGGGGGSGGGAASIGVQQFLIFMAFSLAFPYYKQFWLVNGGGGSGGSTTSTGSSAGGGGGGASICAPGGNGASASGTSTGTSGGGGGGAGGNLLLVTPNPLPAITINLSGGAGGASYNDGGGNGGGGAGGFASFCTPNAGPGSATFTSNGGAGGTGPSTLAGGAGGNGYFRGLYFAG